MRPDCRFSGLSAHGWVRQSPPFASLCDTSFLDCKTKEAAPHNLNLEEAAPHNLNLEEAVPYTHSLAGGSGPWHVRCIHGFRMGARDAPSCARSGRACPRGGLQAAASTCCRSRRGGCGNGRERAQEGKLTDKAMNQPISDNFA
eukprot:363205-Chlamydomonas_euryale.AAC.11